MAFDKKVSISIIGKTDKFVKDLNKGQKALKGLGNVASSIGKATAIGFAGLGVAAATVGKEMVNLASDAMEAEAAFDATFGDAIPEFGTFIEDFSKKAGMASFELKDLMKTSGMVLQGIEMTAEESANMSQALATVAGDVAAFNNVQGGTKPVMEAFTKALLGERESLKTYGIAISEAEVQTKAFEMTGKTTSAELTKMEKAQATYELITAKSAVTQGYLNDEQESFATKSKQAGAQVKELKAKMGEALLPIVTALIPKIIDLVEQVGPQLISAMQSAAPFIEMIGDVLGAMIPPILMVGSILVKMLAPAFKFAFKLIEKFTLPFLKAFPENFEKMINSIVRGMNKFIDKINGFANKAKGLLSKVGIDLGFGEIGRLAEVSFANKAASEIKSVVGTSATTSGGEIAGMTDMALGTAQQQIGKAQQAITINNYAPIASPQDAERIFLQGANQFNKTNGALNRVVTVV